MTRAMARRVPDGYELVVGWCPDSRHRDHPHPPVRTMHDKLNEPGPVAGRPEDWEEISQMMTGALFHLDAPATGLQMKTLFHFSRRDRGLEDMTAHATNQWGWELKRMWRHR